VAQSIREDFLQQNAFVDVDGYTPLEKQYAMLDLIFTYEDQARRAILAGADIESICTLPVHERIGRAKTVSNTEYVAEFDAVKAEIRAQIGSLIEKTAENR
jgi:V/A-type H+-transporting ATPase subunit A